MLLWWLLGCGVLYLILFAFVDVALFCYCVMLWWGDLFTVAVCCGCVDRVLCYVCGLFDCRLGFGLLVGWRRFVVFIVACCGLVVPFALICVGLIRVVSLC